MPNDPINYTRPYTALHVQAYFEKGPDRIFNLRYDSLAVVLSLANIAAGSKVRLLT